MSRPVLRPQDELEILRVIARYARAVDRCDRDLMLQVYHADGVDDHGSFRLPAAEAVDRIVRATRRSVRSQHHMTHSLIEAVDAVTADVETYATCYLVDPPDEPDGPELLRILGLRYLDRVVLRDRWAIATRRVVHDWSTIQPIERTWQTAAKLPAGARDRTDPAYELGPP